MNVSNYFFMKCFKDNFISLKQSIKLNSHFFGDILYEIYHSCTIIRGSTIDSKIVHRDVVSQKRFHIRNKRSHFSSYRH